MTRHERTFVASMTITHSAVYISSKSVAKKNTRNTTDGGLVSSPNGCFASELKLAPTVPPLWLTSPSLPALQNS